MQCMGQRRYKYYNKILLQVHNTNSRYAVPGRDRTEYLPSDLHKNYPWPSAHLVFTFFYFSFFYFYYFFLYAKIIISYGKKNGGYFWKTF